MKSIESENGSRQHFNLSDVIDAASSVESLNDSHAMPYKKIMHQSHSQSSQ